MPVHVVKVSGRYRVVEAATGHVATNAAGTALDGGGHAERARAESQARAVNVSLAQRDQRPVEHKRR